MGKNSIGDPVVANRVWDGQSSVEGGEGPVTTRSNRRSGTAVVAETGRHQRLCDRAQYPNYRNRIAQSHDFRSRLSESVSAEEIEKQAR